MRAPLARGTRRVDAARRSTPAAASSLRLRRRGGERAPWEGGAVPDDVALACVSLFAAWMVNDVEELLTMRVDSAAFLSRAPRWLPVPEVLRTHGLSQ